jgi:hypothetical protein
MNIYRIYPTLWEGTGCVGSLTVYAIDRVASSIPSCCSTRPRADPASSWDSPTFQRLLPPQGCGTVNAVTWSTLPAWISWAMSQGYTLSEGSSLMTLKPYGDLYIVGP